MTPGEVRAVVNVGAVVKVFFDKYEETIRILSVDPDGILCMPVSGGAAAEFWLAYDQISRIEKI